MYMDLMIREEFDKLLTKQEENLISVYIPTHRYGKDVLEGKDGVQLKSLLNELEKDLEGKNIPAKEIKSILKPAYELLEDLGFWRFQSDALVLFIGKNFFKRFTLPLKTDPFYYVGSNFYIKPLVPLFNKNGQFFLLSLTKARIKLYLCSRFTITELKIDDVVPVSMDEALKWDNPEESLQYHSGNAGGSPMYHGQGQLKDQEKQRVWRFFEKVDNKLMDILDVREFPMVLAGIDYEVSIYRKVTKYPGLVESDLQVNPGGINLLQLHQEAYEVAQGSLSIKQQKAFKRYQKLAGTSKASSDLKEVVQASYYKEIDALFLVNSKKDVWGKYNITEEKLELHEHYESKDEKLLNKAAINTLIYGGEVFVVEDSKEMPENSVLASALLRKDL